MSDLNVARMVKVYQRIREKKEQLEQEYKEQIDPLTGQMDKLKAALREYLKEQDMSSTNTPYGQVVRSIRTKYWAGDWEAMGRFIIENEAPELLEKRLNQSNMKQFLEEHPEKHPPGLNIDNEYVITVKKPRKQK